MDPCRRSQGCQMKPKFTIKKENISDALLTSMKLLLQSRKDLCNITESLKSGKKGSFIEVTFLHLSRESGAAQIQGLAVFHVDIPELIQSLHLCNLSENEVILIKEGKTSQSCGLQNFLPGAVCAMTSEPITHFKSNTLYVLLSKYTTGIQYTLEQDCLNRLNRKALNNEDDDTNQSVSSIEDDFVTAFEHLDEEESVAANEKQGCDTMRNQRDASSQTQPAHSLDVTGSKILFSSVRRRSSIKSAVLMGFIGLEELSSTIKNTITTSICDSWKKRRFSDQDKHIFSPSPAASSESECSSPSPIIFLDEEGYQKSMSAKLNLPKIPLGKDDIEDSDSELSEFFDSFDQFDECEPFLETDYNTRQKPRLSSPPKKRKHAHGQLVTGSMNPQRFKYERPMLSANVKKPTPLKPESSYSSICDVSDSPRPAKTSSEDPATLFSPIRSSAFSPLSISTSADCLYHVDAGLCKGKSSTATYSDYANRICIEMFDSIINAKPALNLGVSKKDKATKQKRKSHNRDSDCKQKSKQKPSKGGIHKFATELVEKSLGSAFKDLQKGVSSCTSALCHLAARLTSYVFQMAFYEIGRRQAFSIKQRAISGLANLMVSEVISSALQELRYIKKQMVTNAVTRFAADLAEELVFEGIMEVCQFSHPPTPTVSPSQTFNYEDVIVSSYAKDLSESVIQEAFIELSQVNVTFTTQAAISVSMDNLKYVSSESLMQSTQTSVICPHISDRLQEPPNTEQESNKDYTMQYALLFTSGLVSSVPVPAAAKVLNQQQTKNELCNLNENTDPSDSRDMCIDGVENSALSMNGRSKLASGNIPPPTSICNTYNVLQKQQELDFVQKFEDSEVLKTFSVTMVDRIVNDAYDDVSSVEVQQSVDDYAELLSKKVVEIPSQNHLVDKETSKNCFADDLAKCIMERSIGAARHTDSDKLEVSCDLPITFMDSSCLPQDRNMLKYTPISTKQDHMFSLYTQSREYNSHCSSLPLEFGENYPSSTYLLNSNISFSQTNSEGSSSKIIQNRDMPTSSVFGLQSCLSHINSLSYVMCSCGDNSLNEDKINQRDSSVRIVPGTPPPTPLATYNVSPERSMKKLSKKLKGHLAKEFYPATPPSTPHLSAFEHDCTKKDDFMLKLMRSLSEEVESSSTDESSEDQTEEFEVSEETFQYADYLSTNIISVATEMAAYSLGDDYVHRPALRNRSLLSVLSDRWGYPAYMRNISEESLDTLYKYAGGIVGEVFTDAKKAVGKSLKTQKKTSTCDVNWCHSRNWETDCRPKERSYFKASDTATLSLPRHNEFAGLISKYPSCESVTEEYADHIIRVLKMEGGNSELIMDQYASRLAYRAVKSGLQQASKSVKLKSNRKTSPSRSSNASRTQEFLTLMSRTHNAEKDKLRRRSSIHHFHVEEHGRNVRKTEFTGLLHFAESLAHTITCDVRKKLKMSNASLPKSLTDSCLYSKSKIDDVSNNLVKTSFPKTLIPFAHKNKLYHSTGSLNENGFSEGIIQAIEQYACKVVDSTLEFSMEAARLQAMEKKKKLDKGSSAGKHVHLYGSACRLCSVTEKPGIPASSFHFLLGHDVPRKMKQCSKSKNNSCQKPRLFHLNIPKIHIDLDKRTEFAEKVVSAAVEKAERELSNTSLAGDSGIDQEGVSFADSLTTEIMMSAMKNIGHVVNISKDGFQSADSVTSQQTSISIGDDSTGSWSNVSFEDEHQEESSSFLHLSDSDGPEEKDEDPKVSGESLGQHCKLLLIRNIDVGPCYIESQLRMALQWIAASESDISELYFPEASKKELFAVSRRLREKDWKVGDLLQAVLQYCEFTEKPSSIHKPLFVWLLENV